MNDAAEHVTPNTQVIGTELMVLDPEKYVAAVFATHRDQLQTAKTDAAAVTYDIATTAGMQTATKWRATFRSIRVAAEKARQERKAPILTIGRLLDTRYKELETEIAPLEDRFDADIKAEESRKETARKERERIEAERVTKINQRINWIATQPTEFIGAASEEFAARIAMIAALPVDAEHYAEFLPQAIGVRDATLAKLRAMHATVVANEVEAARLKAEREEFERQKAEQERAAAAERARIAEEDRVAKARRDEEEWVARAAQAAEQKRIADEERLAKQKRDAEEQSAKAQRDAEAAAERKRLDEEARIAREAREAADAKAKAERDEQDRIAAERRAADEKVARERQAEIDRQAAELKRQQDLAAAAEFKRRLAIEAEERRKRDPVIAIDEIHDILQPGSGRNDEDAREAALAVCVRVRGVQEEQKVAA